MKIRLVLLAVLLGLFFSVALAGSVRRAAAAPVAHPMGNFTINLYSALQLQGNGIEVRHVIDMAEIPTYQELGDIRADRNTNLTTAERDGYLGRKVPQIIANLDLRVDNKPLALQQRSVQLSFPPGAGGLPTMRIDVDLFAPFSGATAGQLYYKDSNYSERIGWKEIIAFAGAGGQISNASVPTTDRSKALTVYPADMINSPPLVVDAQLNFAADGVSSAQAQATTGAVPQGTGDWIAGRMDALTQYMSSPDTAPGAVLIALIIAFVLGAGHALTPGHGKTVAAAYLVGTRGTPLHAVLLGLTVTVTHTLGVFALGFITMYAAQYILPDKLYPWISVASGVTVLIMGVWIFIGRWRGLLARGISPLPFIGRWLIPAPVAAAAPGARVLLPVGAGHSHALAPTAHAHDHGHDHDHSHDLQHAEHDHEHADGAAHSHGAAPQHRHSPWGKAHSHVPADNTNISLGNLFALGASGGILPCPSALIVMLSAISFGQVGLGMILIVAFSMGLAVVLMVIGILLLYARRFFDRAPVDNPLLLRLPLASALGVAGLGVIVSVQALATTGLLR